MVRTPDADAVGVGGDGGVVAALDDDVWTFDVVAQRVARCKHLLHNLTLTLYCSLLGDDGRNHKARKILGILSTLDGRCLTNFAAERKEEERRKIAEREQLMPQMVF
jgi:hypothetical protein